MLEPSLKVSGGGFDDAGRSVPGIKERVEAFASQIVDQGELARPRGADVNVVAFGILRGAPIELVENLADGKANVVLAVAQLHVRLAVVGFLRGNPDAQLVAVSAH